MGGIRSQVSGEMAKENPSFVLKSKAYIQRIWSVGITESLITDSVDRSSKAWTTSSPQLRAVFAHFGSGDEL